MSPIRSGYDLDVGSSGGPAAPAVRYTNRSPVWATATIVADPGNDAATDLNDVVVAITNEGTAAGLHSINNGLDNGVPSRSLKMPMAPPDGVDHIAIEWASTGSAPETLDYRTIPWRLGQFSVNSNTLNDVLSVDLVGILSTETASPPPIRVMEVQWNYIPGAYDDANKLKFHVPTQLHSLHAIPNFASIIMIRGVGVFEV